MTLMMGISGVRGIIGASFGAHQAMTLGMAFGAFLRDSRGDGSLSVAIGRDSRPSGPMLSAAISAGLMAVGVDVIELGIVTTPGVGLMTRFLGCDGGVVVTASHNPSQWNGIKLLRHDGIAFPAEQIEAVYQYYHDNARCTACQRPEVGTLRTDSRSHAVHVDTILQYYDLTLIRSKRFRVVLDSINGAGCIVTSELLSKLNAEVVHLNGRPTGDFQHPPEPTEAHLQGLCDAVVSHSAAIGFAQDPDADRLAIVDETGRYIGEEYTLALSAKHAWSTQQGAIAANLSTSRMIDDLAAKVGGRVIRTPVGEANVAHAMLEHDCFFGGEGNGGVIDPRVVMIRDSLTGIARVLELMSRENRALSAIISQFPSYKMVKEKLECPRDKVPSLLDEMRQHYETVSGVKVDTQDGLRIDWPDGWLHIRPSNTEPVVRIMAESPDQQKSQERIEQVKDTWLARFSAYNRR